MDLEWNHGTVDAVVLEDAPCALRIIQSALCRWTVWEISAKPLNDW